MLPTWFMACAFAAELVVGVDAPSVQESVDLAQDGDTVVVGAGEWPGPVVVRRAITLTSRDGGILVTDGAGDTVRIEAAGASLDGLHLRGSGDDLNTDDACVRTSEGATGAVIQDSTFEGCLFGIYIDTTKAVRVLRNRVVGRPEARDHDRGNGIHLFNASHLEIRGNTVEHARDGIYVSVTQDSVIADNVASNQRFGIHYMYSYDNEVSGNKVSDNNVGMALMMSLRLKVFDNEATGNRRQGMLFRDIQYCDIHHNTVQGNAEGLFFYSSLDNDIHHNALLQNQVGARVWAGTERNRWWANAWQGNRQALFYVSAYDQTWGTEEDGGNYWSDHLAWDQDDDGFADRPYRADVTVASLLHRFPSAVLLLSSPALELLRAMQAKLPALRRPSVVDPRPLIRPVGGAR